MKAVFAFFVAIGVTQALLVAAEPPLSMSEYIERLDSLIAAVERSTDDPSSLTSVGELPNAWRVDGSPRVFDIPTAPVRRDLRAWRTRRDAAARDRLLNTLRELRSDAVSFERSAVDSAATRARLLDILAADEFRDVHGPTWIDRLQQRIFELIARVLGRALERSSIATIGNAIVYALVALAVLVLALWAYRFVRRTAATETLANIAPGYAAPSTREWTAWLTDAQAAAARGSWRDAIHLIYWCAVSFLEAKGAWRPDRARTPREYLRLLAASRDFGDSAAPMAALTRRFELVWYGTGDADAQAFADSIANLKNMGCPTS
jgi:hypothetical protein